MASDNAIEPPKFIVCVGEFARRDRVQIDLERDLRDKREPRIILFQSEHDAHRILGLRGVWWIDYCASSRQRAMMQAGGLNLEVTTERARKELAATECARG